MADAPLTTPAQVVMTDDAMIRRTTPANVIAGLEADARRMLSARPDMACTVVNHSPRSGPRQQLIVLFAGYEVPADNGFTSYTFVGDPRAVDEMVRRTLRNLVAGADDAGSGSRGGQQ